MAFNVVNVKLLMKILKIVGSPDALIEMMDKWLSIRYFCCRLYENQPSGFFLVDGSSS